MNMYGNPKTQTIPANVTGAVNILITCTPTETSKKGATVAYMRYANLVLMPNASVGRKRMNKAFEIWVRQRYGNRYDLSRDQEGFYCREVVKRMFETWCHCRGLDVM
ncbi:hypothetical protein C3375_20870 [Citrobacter freundii complex sp. CFNIH12]|nr:hypothetical protein C3375_20870 [Citrobacter freundii complex sp. CFNIH12]